MKPRIGFAPLPTVFAGATAVAAKQGLAGISAEAGLVLRTALLFLFVLAFAAFTVSRGDLAAVTRENPLWLGVTALAAVVLRERIAVQVVVGCALVFAGPLVLVRR